LTPLRLLRRLHLLSRRPTWLRRTLLPFDMPPTLPQLPLKACAVASISVAFLLEERMCVDGAYSQTDCH